MANRRLTRQGGATVAWCLLGFVGLQLGVALALQCWRVERIDRPFGHKLALLRARQARELARPLVLMLGSSRTFNGVRPGLLPASVLAGPEAPLVFNFGFAGHGPFQELLSLRRLLERGVRPRCVFVEVVPAHLYQEAVADDLPLDRLAWGDLPALSRYAPSHAAVYWNWAASRVAPCFTFREAVLSRTDCRWLPRGWHHWRPERMDDLGWLEMAPPGDRAQYERELAKTRQDFSPTLHTARISETTDRALRDLLSLCRQEGLQAALLVMPEARVFQSCYSPSARAAGDAYLKALSEEFGTPLTDARDWVPDDEFRDGHHLLATGARTFTERFGREALGPLLRRHPSSDAERAYSVRH